MLAPGLNLPGAGAIPGRLDFGLAAALVFQDGCRQGHVALQALFANRVARLKSFQVSRIGAALDKAIGVDDLDQEIDIGRHSADLGFTQGAPQAADGRLAVFTPADHFGDQQIVIAGDGIPW